MTRLTFECDPEPYGKERDGAIIKLAQEFGVETIVRNSHTLYNLDRFVSAHTHVQIELVNVDIMRHRSDDKYFKGPYFEP